MILVIVMCKIRLDYYITKLGRQTVSYYLPTEKELFKVSTIWDFVLQQSWFKQKHKYKEYTVYCPRGRSHREWLEQEGIVEFMKKDIKMSQLCRISYFYSGEELFYHCEKALLNVLMSSLS